MIAYEDRVQQLELEGCTTSDAQSVADVEVMDNKIAPSAEAQAHAAVYAKWKLSRDARLANRSAS
jgi:hypothetical protein